MTKAAKNTATRTRVVDAPLEASDAVQESPAPPLVTSPRRVDDRGDNKRRGSTVKAVLHVVVVGLMLGGVSAGTVLGTYQFAKTSPRFALRQVDVNGIRHRSRDSIVSASQLSVGKNIFSIDTDAAERAILSDPWIREVKVERRLPATVRIELVEREAGALAMIGEQMLLVSRSGEPFKKYEPADPIDLPLITGIVVDASAKDPALDRRRINIALDVLRNYERTAMARVHVAQEVHLTPGGEVVLLMG
ncbi:MAG TPA: FtsQ-type POTRA domain-containing protein, partial [Polyangiaceae bacterium]